MSTLLLTLEGPMQSWGTRSRFGVRDTGRAPSKSGVVGLLAAALGRGRDEPLDDLVAFRMGVRLDRPGSREVDFQTALDVAKASGATPDTAMSWRQYLADASFTVGLEADRALLEAFVAALRAPVWALYLGRRGYVPSAPLLPAAEPVLDVDLVAALRKRWPASGPDRLEALIECLSDEDGDAVDDLPLSFSIRDRAYAPRLVRSVWLEAEETACS
jgi:CRISPR system Cascade subunit CasD